MSNRVTISTVLIFVFLVSVASAQSYDITVRDGTMVTADTANNKVLAELGFFINPNGFSQDVVDMKSSRNSETNPVYVINSGNIVEANVDTSYRYTQGGGFFNADTGTIGKITNTSGFVENQKGGTITNIILRGTQSQPGSFVSNYGNITNATINGGTIDNYGVSRYITAAATQSDVQIRNFDGVINSVSVNAGTGSKTTVVLNAMTGASDERTPLIKYVNISGENNSFQNGSGGTISEAILNGTGIGTYTSFNGDGGNISKLTMRGFGGNEVANRGNIGELNVHSGILRNYYYNGTYDGGEIDSLTLGAGQVENMGADALIKAFTINGGDVINGASANLGTGTLTGYGTLVNDAHVDNLTLHNARMKGTGTFDVLTINGINSIAPAPVYEGGLLDTTKFTGLIGDMSFANNGEISFVVGLDSYSRANIFGEVDLSNGIVSVYFNNSFATSDWTMFNLANLFNFDTGFGVGSFANDVLWGSFLLNGLDDIEYYYADSWIVRGTEPPAGAAPEPATLLIFGLGLVSLGLARRKRK